MQLLQTARKSWIFIVLVKVNHVDRRGKGGDDVNDDRNGVIAHQWSFGRSGKLEYRGLVSHAQQGE